MASVTHRTVEITPAVPAVTEDHVVLEITKNEAEVLASLLGACAYGGPSSGMYDALYSAGVSDTNYVLRNADNGYIPTIQIKPRGV